LHLVFVHAKFAEEQEEGRQGDCVKSKGVEKICSFELSGKEIFLNYDETKSKEEKNKKNGSKKRHRGQSV
jgi:hypothetical protein